MGCNILFYLYNKKFAVVESTSGENGSSAASKNSKNGRTANSSQTSHENMGPPGDDNINRRNQKEWRNNQQPGTSSVDSNDRKDTGDSWGDVH